jgi:predicted DNA-binding transcriptional regulator AlpA
MPKRSARDAAQPDRLLTPPETAEYLRTAEQTLAKWRYLGDGPPYVRISHGAIRYRRSDLDAWLARRTVETA